MKTAEEEELFDRIHRDAQAWLAQANRLRMSAAVIEQEWKRAISQPPSTPGVQERRLAYSESFMLLIAFAFENLLKGILYGRDPSSPLAKVKGGHGIARMANCIKSITPDEQSRLERVEHYLTWAGRYELPTKPEKFRQSQGQIGIHPGDSEAFDRLFDTFIEVLQSEWQSRERSARD